MDYGFILSWEDGRPCTPAWVYHTFSKLLKDNNLQHIRVHDLRHTAATLMLYQGVDIKLVSHQLRHQNTEITQNLYQHVLEEITSQPADAMDALFKGK